MASLRALDNSWSANYINDIDKLIASGSWENYGKALGKGLTAQLATFGDASRHVVYAITSLPSSLREGRVSTQAWHIMRALSFLAQGSCTPLVVFAPKLLLRVADGLKLRTQWEPSSCKRLAVQAKNIIASAVMPVYHSKGALVACSVSALALSISGLAVAECIKMNRTIVPQGNPFSVLEVIGNLPWTPMIIVGLLGGYTLRNRLNVNSSGSNESLLDKLIGETPKQSFAKCCVDLTETARLGKLSQCFGREDIVNSVLNTLGRKTKSNVILVGEPGVGKSAIAQGLAWWTAQDGDNVPLFLKGKKIVSLNANALAAGTSAVGMFERRLKNIIETVEEDNGNTILFIDEIHALMGASSSKSGGQGAGPDMIKPLLARGNFHCIGATTNKEYELHISDDSAFERRFNKIDVPEPTPEQTITILTKLRPEYEAHHKLSLTDEALKAAATMAKRYLTDRNLPDSAIDLLDEAAVAAKARGENNVGEVLIAEMVTKKTRVPVAINMDDAKQLLGLEERLSRRVIGQDHAVKTISQAMRRSRSGLGDPKRPTGSFIFTGPTGVGKTELAKALAAEMFGSEKHFIQLNMAEYNDPIVSSTKLIGAPNSYYDAEKGGQLTTPLSRQGYSVVLLDEVEKADPKVWDIFLAAFEEGQIKDGRGQMINCRNAIFILTSNVPQENLKQNFRPEFLNRIDAILPFAPLDSSERLFPIVIKELTLLQDRWKEQNIDLQWDQETVSWLAANGFDAKFGARPLKRLINDKVVDPVANLKIANNLGNVVQLSVDENTKTIKVTAPKIVADELE